MFERAPDAAVSQMEMAIQAAGRQAMCAALQQAVRSYEAAHPACPHCGGAHSQPHDAATQSGADAPSAVQIGRLPTKAIATRVAVGWCGSVAFRTPFPNAATSGRGRTVVERCNNQLKPWRGLAARYEQRAVNYRAMVAQGSIVLGLEP